MGRTHKGSSCNIRKNRREAHRKPDRRFPRRRKTFVHGRKTQELSTKQVLPRPSCISSDPSRLRKPDYQAHFRKGKRKNVAKPERTTCDFNVHRINEIGASRRFVDSAEGWLSGVSQAIWWFSTTCALAAGLKPYRRKSRTVKHCQAGTSCRALDTGD
jgi:hypothetical protein